MEIETKEIYKAMGYKEPKNISELVGIMTNEMRKQIERDNTDNIAKIIDAPGVCKAQKLLEKAMTKEANKLGIKIKMTVMLLPEVI